MSPHRPALSRDRLLEELSGVGWIHRVELLAEAPSTNDVAASLVRQGAPGGTVVLAERQTAGRGRQGRPWHSPPGLGLYLSVIVRPERLPSRSVPRCTIASALAACRACRALGATRVTIKWPNDLLYEGRKLAGTLTEARCTGDRVESVIVGTGFNVNHHDHDFPDVLRPLATSIRVARGGDALQRERLAGRYLAELGALIEALQQNGWPNLAQAWCELAPNARGARVRVGPHAPPGASTTGGVTCGIDDDGSLLVKLDDGGVVVVRSTDSLIPEV